MHRTCSSNRAPRIRRFRSFLRQKHRTASRATCVLGRSIDRSTEELTVLVDDVKITFLKYPFPTFDPFVIYEKAPLLSVREIAATKAYQACKAAKRSGKSTERASNLVQHIWSGSTEPNNGQRP